MIADFIFPTYTKLNEHNIKFHFQNHPGLNRLLLSLSAVAIYISLMELWARLCGVENKPVL